MIYISVIKNNDTPKFSTDTKVEYTCKLSKETRGSYTNDWLSHSTW